jgi:hypothetical protein
VRNNLGQVIQCVSHVSTRLRYVRKSTENFGSQKKAKVILRVYVSQRTSVLNVLIESNAPNGVLTMNDSVSGVDSLPERESQYATVGK